MILPCAASMAGLDPATARSRGEGAAGDGKSERRLVCGSALPGTPLYKRLDVAGRLTRPKHWQEFIPFAMAHTPLKMSIDEAHEEVNYGWSHAYGAEAIAEAVDSLDDQPLGYRVNIFIARVCFRGIYFPMLGRFAWWKVISENRKTIFKLAKQGFEAGLTHRP